MVEKWSIRLVRSGEHTVPSPLAYFMKDFDRYERLVFHMALIRSGNKKIILNTGMPVDMKPLMQHWYNTDPGIKAEKASEFNDPTYLSQLGFAPQSVSSVILSPLVSYATGNLDLYTNAKIFFSKTGWVQLMNKNPVEQMPEREINFPDKIMSHLVTDWWDRVYLLEDHDVIENGIEVIRTGGHHFSSLLIIVNTEIGRVGLTDSFFTYRNLQEHIPIGVGVSLEESISSMKIAERNCDIIVPMLESTLMEKYRNGIIV
ncbi:MAG: hypothetical protein RE471_05805 [Ferroplasma sp.]|uniref:hypothetical protein n=1 Tax=Ferroplasma sp. TaxID=2591003 RepID=UPI002815E13E|nr:hypothetical protein [Ferroplasma sp.]WMT50495.1 MAG: hypothetical protein RE471_05805 [Ferroplasma sp.]